ncbi:uncharacterized protein EI90DRAFT_1350117 [Cantharellus anzutake]|uniref:uncharacterized protein n=1 Tax=Cantharellus anzutake TaxID=1750568 RepID=UPI001908DA12|nr:uncharacterized protein EI90DRAFT_1350117 [Cantharellus anzutake]KAF8329826.1 hypothetical protein EI90DRAFT_1350117 [Cantharellus anzutake]
MVISRNCSGVGRIYLSICLFALGAFLLDAQGRHEHVGIRIECLCLDMEGQGRCCCFSSMLPTRLVACGLSQPVLVLCRNQVCVAQYPITDVCNMLFNPGGQLDCSFESEQVDYNATGGIHRRSPRRQKIFVDG